jgi:transposase InsO family protein
LQRDDGERLGNSRLSRGAVGRGGIEPGTASIGRTARRCSSACLFDSLDQVRAITDAGLETYNTERPHESLGQVPPLSFLPRPDAPAESTFAVST